MAGIPATSITLLNAISGSPDSARWTEFFGKYESLMRGFLRTRFPSVEPEDAIQETMLALCKALPRYTYTPDEKGHFRNYLIGLLSHKAADILRRDARHSSLVSGLRNGRRGETDARREADADGDHEYEAWKISAMEAAVEQLMANDAIRPATREVFRHVALMHENPEDVARMFGITRNNVDQIKKRMIEKLAATVRAMTRD